MNTTKLNVNNLAAWINSLREKTMNGEQFTTAWFEETKDAPISIVGGWLNGFAAFADSGSFCMNKSNKDQALCIAVVVNNGEDETIELDDLKFCDAPNGVPEDLSIAISPTDDTKVFGAFLIMEWERIMNAHKEEI